MQMHRNVHVYVAYRTVLIEEWRQVCGEPPYEPKVFKGFTKAEEKDLTDEQKREVIDKHNSIEQAKEKAYEEKLALDYSMQLHTAYVQEVAAVAFDFTSPEADATAALPQEDCEPHFFHLKTPKYPMPALELLVGLHKMVSENGIGPLASKYTSWRGYDPRFLRLAARNQAARTLKDKMRRLYMPLYFQSNTLDWNSCIGAEKYGNSDVLIQQMQLRENDFKDPVLNELSKTLQLFSRFGLAPEVDLRHLAK